MPTPVWALLWGTISRGYRGGGWPQSDDTKVVGAAARAWGTRKRDASTRDGSGTRRRGAWCGQCVAARGTMRWCRRGCVFWRCRRVHRLEY